MLFLIGISGCLFAFIVTQQIRSPIELQQFDADAEVSDLKLDPQDQPKPAPNERYVYPYSVIPGGVFSREELIGHINSDPVVAEHFARFAADQVKIVKAEETQFMYVAYRLHDKVYWTAKKIKIPKGESLITDGKDFARTRCGNRVSAVPVEPVEEKEEPSAETFETPTLLARVSVPDLPGVSAHGQEVRDIPPMERYVEVKRQKILPYYYRPLFTFRPREFLVPEPATLSLLAVGLVAFITFRIARKK